jgi:hypothetical protein
MFIAPNEKLYVMTNMRNDPTVEPKVFIYDANDYSFIQSFDITNLPNNDDEFEFYSAHFCYNHYNQKVYATIHPTEINLDPYNTIPNSMFEYPIPNQGLNNIGLLIKFDDNHINQIRLVYPGKITCPDIGDPLITSQYDGKMFIIGKKFYVYNILTDAIDPTDGFDQSFNDITYSAFHDKLFAIKDVEDECGDDRKCEIYSIDYVNNNIDFNCIGNFDGQASSIFSNPYDGKIYMYNKIDDEKLGGTQVCLLNFDYNPGAPNQNINYIDLGVTSFYPDLDHTPDHCHFFYNITTPYIDPYDTAIYLPNGGHSCISKVFFETNEALLLNNGERAWLSFPRLDRTQGDPTVHEILYGVNGENIDPNNYLINSELQNLPPNDPEIDYNVFDGTEWLPTGGLIDIQSTRGYKLKLLYENQPEKKWLHLFGDVLDPTEDITIYGPYENWVGYFLYTEQDVFDALADVIDDLYLIKAQDWTCVYTIPCARDPYNQGGCWIWDNEVHNVKYGDMLILKTYLDQLTFQWNYSGNRSNDEPRSAPEYYSYEEKADYTPMIIELDSTGNLLEIGAFINDSCIGANTVLPDDTIVVLRAYMDGQPGDSVTFEKYYGSSKSYTPPIHDYFVNNKQTGTWEKRTIKTGEKQDYYLISFKTGKITNETESNPVSINCAPNPLKNEVTIKFTVQQECMLQIGVFDLYGKSLNILQGGVSKAGTYSINWTGTDSNGKPLPNGVYILKLQAGTNYAQTKIIIMK